MVYWEGYDDVELPDQKENWDKFELFDSDVYDMLLNYYKNNPDDSIEVFEEGECEEGVLPHDLKPSMCKNGLYVGKNKAAYKGVCAKKGLDD